MDRDAWNARYDATEMLWGVAPNRFLAAEVANLMPGVALDLATGEGRNAVWLAEHGWTVTGVDFSDVAIERAKNLASEHGVRASWIVEDVVAFEPEPGAFDLIAICYLHLPAEDLATVLRHARGGLASEGTLVVVGHDVTNIADGVGGPQDPEILYSPDGIATQLDGLWVQRAERVRRPVEVDGTSRDAIDTLVRARRPRLRA